MYIRDSNTRRFVSGIALQHLADAVGINFISRHIRRGLLVHNAKALDIAGLNIEKLLEHGGL